MTFRLQFGAHDPDYPYLNNDDTRRPIFIVAETKDQVKLQTLNNNSILQNVKCDLDLDDREEDDQHETWKNSDAFDKDYNRILKHKPSELNQFWERMTLEVIGSIAYVVNRSVDYNELLGFYEMVTEEMENFVLEEAEELRDKHDDDIDSDSDSDDEDD